MEADDWMGEAKQCEGFVTADKKKEVEQVNMFSSTSFFNNMQ